jgi:hypothetical protein
MIANASVSGSIDVEVIEQLGGHDFIKAMKPTAAQYGSNAKTPSASPSLVAPRTSSVAWPSV